MIKKLAFLLLAVSVASVSLSGCFGLGEEDTTSQEAASSAVSTVTTTETTSSETATSTVYTDGDKTFQLTIPSGWTSSATKDDTVLFVSPQGNQSVEIVKQTADPNLLAYAKSDFQETYGASFSHFQLKEFSQVTANRHTGVRLSYTCTQNGQSYTVVQYILAGDSDYNITYSATGDSSELSSLAESSINTFRELDPDNDPSLLVNRLATRDYRDGAKGYSLTLPKNWRVASQTSDTVVFTDVDETYSINVQCSEADSSLFRYQQSYFDDYFTAAFGQTATISQFQTTTLSDTKALYLVCSYTYHGTALTSKQYIVNSDDTAYHITFTAPTASASKIDFAAVAKSFRLP